MTQQIANVFVLFININMFNGRYPFDYERYGLHRPN